MGLFVCGLGRSYLAGILRGILTDLLPWDRFDLDRERLKHTHILGSTGCGKSAAIAAFIDGNIRRGQGFILVEPHGELVDRVLHNRRFSLNHPSQAYQKVVYLNFDEAPPALNIFNLPLPQSPLHQEAFISGLSSDIADALCWNMKPEPTDAQAVMLRNLLMLGFYWKGAILEDLVDLLSTEGQSRLQGILSSLPVPPLQRYFRTDFLSGTATLTRQALRLRLNSFLVPKQVYQSLCASRCEINFTDVLQNDKFVIVKATSALLGDYEARTLGSLIHNLMNKYAFERLVSGRKCKPFFAYFDEAQYYLTHSVQRALTGARKTGLNYTLAHHEFNQEGISPSQQRTIINNCNVKLYGRLHWRDLKDACGILRMSDPCMLENVTPGTFYLRTGQQRAVRYRVPYKYAVHRAGFGSQWFGNVYMKALPYKAFIAYLRKAQQSDAVQSSKPTSLNSFKIHGAKKEADY